MTQQSTNLTPVGKIVSFLLIVPIGVLLAIRQGLSLASLAKIGEKAP